MKKKNETQLTNDAAAWLAQFGVIAEVVKRDKVLIQCSATKKSVSNLVRRIGRTERVVHANGYCLNPILWQSPHANGMHHRVAVFAKDLELQGYLHVTTQRDSDSVDIKLINAA